MNILSSQIGLVSDKNDDEVGTGAGHCFLHKPIDGIEGLPRGDVEGQEGTNGSAVTVAYPLKYDRVMDLKLSCPAVSHICSFITFPLLVTVFDPNSTPIVGSFSCLNLLSVNWIMRQDFPTSVVREESTGLADDDVLEQEGVL